VNGKAWVVAILIIDKHHQRKGYGRAAMEQVIQQARTEAPDKSGIVISYRPSNVVAERLYTSLGFKPEGEFEGDVLAWFRFQPPSVYTPARALNLLDVGLTGRLPSRS